MNHQKLQQHYENPSLQGSLSGFQAFYHALKKKDAKVKRPALKKWMESQETYTLHHPARKRYPRNKVVSGGIDDIWQMDLVDMRNIVRFNKNYKYMITCIDVFSKYAWVIPLKSKNAQDVLKGFKNIVETSHRKPNRIQVDQGKEFLNKDMNKYLEKQKIVLYTLNSEQKASVIERFNRTLKEKMYRYFTAKGIYNYIDVIDDILNVYNNSYHRSIKLAPNKVTKENEEDVRNNLYNVKDEFVNFKFKIGDYVRISKNKRLFEKGYTPNWTREIFEILEIIPRIPPI